MGSGALKLKMNFRDPRENFRLQFFLSAGNC
jgi:hypothetical protein